MPLPSSSRLSNSILLFIFIFERVCFSLSRDTHDVTYDVTFVVHSLVTSYVVGLFYLCRSLLTLY